MLCRGVPFLSPCSPTLLGAAAVACQGNGFGSMQRNPAHILVVVMGWLWVWPGRCSKSPPAAAWSSRSLGVIQSCSLCWLWWSQCSHRRSGATAQACTGDFINLPPFVSDPSWMAQGEGRIKTAIFICKMDKKRLSSSAERDNLLKGEIMKPQRKTELL